MLNSASISRIIVSLGLSAFFLNSCVSPSPTETVFSSPGSQLNCTIQGQKEYLVFVQAPSNAGRLSKQFGADYSLGLEQIECTCEFEENGAPLQIQNFKPSPLFPGEKSTFRLLSGIWINEIGVHKIRVVLSRVPKSLDKPKVLVVPWCTPVKDNKGIFKVVPTRDLPAGYVTNVTDFDQYKMITPMDPVRFDRFPIIGFTVPVGLKTKRTLLKGSALYPSDFELPSDPVKIKQQIEESCAHTWTK
jgi:hypothetical protein